MFTTRQKVFPTLDEASYEDNEDKTATIAGKYCNPLPAPSLEARTERNKIHIVLVLLNGWKLSDDDCDGYQIYRSR